MKNIGRNVLDNFGSQNSDVYYIAIFR